MATEWESSTKTHLDRINEIDKFISKNWKALENRLKEKKKHSELDLTYLPCYHENLFNLFGLRKIFPYIARRIEKEFEKEGIKIEEIMKNYVTERKENVGDTFQDFRDFYSCIRIFSKNSTQYYFLRDILNNFEPHTSFLNFLNNDKEPQYHLVNAVSIALIALTRCLIKFPEYQNKLITPLEKGINLMLKNKDEEPSSVFLTNLVVLSELKEINTGINSQILEEMETSIKEIYCVVKDIIKNYGVEEIISKRNNPPNEIYQSLEGYQLYFFLIGLKYMRDYHNWYIDNHDEFVGIINKLTDAALKDDINSTYSGGGKGEARLFAKCIALAKIKKFYWDLINEETKDPILPRLEEIEHKISELTDKIKNNKEGIKKDINQLSNIYVNLRKTIFIVIYINMMALIILFVRDVFPDDWIPIISLIIGFLALLITLIIFYLRPSPPSE